MGINRNFFFEQVNRTLFTGKLSVGQRAGLTAILDEWEANFAKNYLVFAAVLTLFVIQTKPLKL